MTAELDAIAARLPARRADRISQGTAIEQARAVAEVAAAVQVAQQNPRDITRAIEQMRQSCQQKALAERAFYSLPRAGGRVEGETVHLARELARCWGNIDYGIRELRRDDDDGQSEMQAWAWDQEQNVRPVHAGRVHRPCRTARMKTDKHTKVKSRELLVDLGDIANNNNSVAARAVRETIFNVLPVWFKDEAVAICTATLQDGGGKTLAQQVADAIGHFREKWNVRVEQIETRIDRDHDQWTAQDLGLLRVISGELSRGEKRVGDEFPTRVSAEDITGASTPRGVQAEDGDQADPDQAAAPAPEPPQAPPPATPTPEPAQPDDETNLASREQLNAIHAAFRALGITDRTERLTITRHVIGRQIASAKDLWRAEAGAVLDELAERRRRLDTADEDAALEAAYEADQSGSDDEPGTDD